GAVIGDLRRDRREEAEPGLRPGSRPRQANRLDPGVGRYLLDRVRDLGAVDEREERDLVFLGEQAQEREDREPVAAIRWIRGAGAQDRDLHEDLLLDRLTVGSAG